MPTQKEMNPSTDALALPKVRRSFALPTHIDEKVYQLGMYIAAEVRYNEAQQKVTLARSRLSNEYAQINSDLAAGKSCY